MPRTQEEPIMKSKERYENLKRLHLSEGEINYHLDVSAITSPSARAIRQWTASRPSAST